MWKYFLLGLVAGWLIEWIIVRYRASRRDASTAVGVTTTAAAGARLGGAGMPGTPAETGVGTAGTESRAEAERDATTAGTGAGTVSGRIAMGAPGAVSTSSATLYSHASVYRQWDLEAIPGLVPRVAAVLRDHGIDSFAKLAATPSAELDRIVGSAGHDPQALGTSKWTELATLAAGHDWAGFAALAQARLQESGRAGGAGDPVTAAGVAT